jgi:hypothetical protein
VFGMGTGVALSASPPETCWGEGTGVPSPQIPIPDMVSNCIALGEVALFAS